MAMTPISKEEHERAKLRAQKKFEMDMTSNMITAKRIGIGVGIEMGIRIAAKRMLGTDMPIDVIAAATGLTEQEIKSL